MKVSQLSFYNTLFVLGILVISIFLFFNQKAFSKDQNLQSFSGKVVYVKDGDSLIVKNGRKNVEVRLSGIDAPEYSQRYGQYCKENLMNKVLGQTVEVKPVDIDMYGRHVSFIELGNEDISRFTVKTGCAWAYTKYLHDKYVIKLEADARAKKIGLWADPPASIVPPWQYRKLNR